MSGSGDYLHAEKLHLGGNPWVLPLGKINPVLLPFDVVGWCKAPQPEMKKRKKKIPRPRLLPAVVREARTRLVLVTAFSYRDDVTSCPAEE